jgi:hypothetical protein
MPEIWNYCMNRFVILSVIRSVRDVFVPRSAARNRALALLAFAAAGFWLLFGARVMAAADAGLLSLTPQQWRDDLAVFARELPKQHPDAFTNTPKEKFDAEVAALAAQVDHLNSDEIFVGLDRIANLIGDAHTYLQFPKDDANLPMDVRHFGGESRVRVVGADYEQALGARVVAIQDTPIAKARELAGALTPIAETPELREARIDALLTTGMALHGLGITKDRNETPFTLASDDGKEFTITFKSLALGAPDPKWLMVNNSLAEHDVNGSAACTFLPEARTVYCAVRKIRDLGGPSKQMLEIIKREHPEKVVIDLRENEGGDFNVGMKYLIEPLAKDSSINQKGHLFVLIGPDTFSAAMSNAGQFRSKTQATLVGQTIGERPNSIQEPRQFVLPNSKWVVRYSTKYYKFADGAENVIAPDKEIIPTWEQYKSGHDVVLDWVLAYK